MQQRAADTRRPVASFFDAQARRSCIVNRRIVKHFLATTACRHLQTAPAKGFQQVTQSASRLCVSSRLPRWQHAVHTRMLHGVAWCMHCTLGTVCVQARPVPQQKVCSVSSTVCHIMGHAVCRHAHHPSSTFQRPATQRRSPCANNMTTWCQSQPARPFQRVWDAC